MFCQVRFGSCVTSVARLGALSAYLSLFQRGQTGDRSVSPAVTMAVKGEIGLKSDISAKNVL